MRFCRTCFFSWIVIGFVSSTLANENDSTGVAVDIPAVLEDQKLSLHRISLRKAISTALSGNRDLQSAYSQRELEKVDLSVAENVFSPRFELTGDVTSLSPHGTSKSLYEFNQLIGLDANLSFPTGAEATLSWLSQINNSTASEAENSAVKLRISQPLLRGGGWSHNTSSIRTARLQEKSNLLSLKETAIEIVKNVIFKYRELFLANQRAEIAKRSLLRSEEILRVNEELVNAGRMARDEILQAKTEILSRQLDVSESLSAVNIARLELLNDLGLTTTTEFNIDRKLEITNIDVLSNTEAIKLAHTNKPLLQRTRINREIAEINLQRARNASLWRFDFNAEFTSSGSAATLADTTTSSPIEGSNFNSVVGLSLSIPFGDPGKNKPKVEARTQLQQALNSSDEQKASMQITIKQLTSRIKHLRQRVGIAEKLVELANDQLETERFKLSEGLSSSVNMSQFENQLTEAQDVAATAIVGYLNGVTELNAEIGTLLDRWDIVPFRIDGNGTSKVRYLFSSQ